MARTMYVSVSDIMRDPDQTTVYNLQTDRRYVVEGCAGSGKSSLALLLLQKILAELGEDDETPTPVYYVTTAHELVECVRQQFPLFDSPPTYNDYAITGGKSDKGEVKSMWESRTISDLQRKNQVPNGPYVINSRSCMLSRRETQGEYRTFINEDIKINRTPDYLLVDEAQDFSCISIEDFLRSAKKGCVFYGDDTQSIMGFANPMHLSDIVALLEAKYGRVDTRDRVIVYRYSLKRNWRLSKEIAAFAQALPNGVADPDLLRRCRGEYKEKPVLQQLNSQEDMVDYIRQRAIRATLDDDVGIILRTNEDVYRFFNELRGMGNVSARYNVRVFDGESEWEEYEYLSDTPVKIMTYENAKGQQFRDVFLIASNDIKKDKEGFNRFYVGVTRAERFLRIMYSGQKPTFLENIDPDLFVTTDR